MDFAFERIQIYRVKVLDAINGALVGVDRLFGLGLDSLDTVDMVIVLEKAFGFKIREEKEIREIRTLGDIHGFVIRKKRLLEAA